MREIKFNYLIVRHSGFSFNKTFTLEEIQNGIVTSWLSVNMIFDDYYKRQFTGLTDKNGKEIYEGDIVKGSFTDQENDNYDFIDKVTFADGKFQCENNADFDLWIYEIEIIGNIYENPELL